MTQIAGRYTLEAEIGRGGMGAVWRGRDDVLGRTVALKRIGTAPGGITPDALRAEREAKLAAKLNHANVVAVFDLAEQATPDGLSQQWLVMEYVEGTDLAELIRTRGRLAPDEAAPILAQTASALAAAHGAGIVHRDVKPSNILVAPDGQVKLSDFGIARTAADPSLTQTGLVTGSPAYMSPEVASGQLATPASDVWSWGATLFHALEGRPPYQIGDNLLGALYRIVHEEPPRTEAAGWLAPVLAATMTRDAGQRWPMTRVHEFLESGPTATQPNLATTGGLADIGLAEPVRTRSYDDGGSTQVLPLTTATTAPPPPPTRPDRGADPESPRRPWAIVVGAAGAVVVAMAIAFAIGLHDGGGDDESGGPTSPSASTSESSSPESPSSAGPTEDGMTTFTRDYIDTAVSDPASAFKMLTPEFQEQSNGLQGYEDFWDQVRNAKILSISADPDALEVSYRYRYVRPGGPTVDDVTLQLSFEDGSYLIAGER
jgi:serine/threonine protein kinase